MVDFAGESGDGPWVVDVLGVVFLDDGPDDWVAVESCATDAGDLRDRGERDRFAL